jgi:hypothetical protein
MVAAWENYHIPADFARRMEIERNEAREKIERQAARIRYLEGATNLACGTPLSVALNEVAKLARTLREERDAWRNHAERFAAILSDETPLATIGTDVVEALEEFRSLKEESK